MRRIRKSKLVMLFLTIVTAVSFVIAAELWQQGAFVGLVILMLILVIAWVFSGVYLAARKYKGDHDHQTR